MQGQCETNENISDTEIDIEAVDDKPENVDLQNISKQKTDNNCSASSDVEIIETKVEDIVISSDEDVAIQNETHSRKRPIEDSPQCPNPQKKCAGYYPL